MGWVLGRRIRVQRVLDRVGRADNLGVAVLALGGPHGEAGEEAAVAVFELAQGVADIAAGGHVSSFLMAYGRVMVHLV